MKMLGVTVPVRAQIMGRLGWKVAVAEDGQRVAL